MTPSTGTPMPWDYSKPEIGTGGGPLSRTNALLMTGGLEKTKRPSFTPRWRPPTYARAIIELLQIPSNEGLLTVFERAIEFKSQKENLPIDVAANALFNNAALNKIAGGPEDWLGGLRISAVVTGILDRL